MGGAADRFPEGPDGIVTATELYAYLRQGVQISTDQRQNPQLGDLSARQSEGEFFFLNRSRQVSAKVVPEWNPVLISSGVGNEQMLASDEKGVVAQNRGQLATLTGTIPLSGRSFVMDVSGSFGTGKIEGTGGTLHVELSLSPTGGRYEQIEFRSSFINQRFAGVFSAGFGKPPIPIDLSLSFFVIVSTSRPSPELPLLAMSDGGFQLGPFYTSACGFSCYYLEIIGSWTAKGSDLTANGNIRSVLLDAIGADATGHIDPEGYPKSVQLKGFSWHGNSGGGAIPDLVSASVDGVNLQLFCNYIGFPGVQGTDLKLVSNVVGK